MNFAVVSSEQDEAGMNIFRCIHEEIPSLNHYLIKEDSIHAENIDKSLLKNYDFIIFATRHKSQEHRKTFSVHAPGNWKNAEFGGREGKVCKTSALFLKHLFKTLSQETKKMKSDYECTLECTHHGPFIEKPCCFIEIGTTKEEWQDKLSARIIAEIIKRAINSFNEKENWKPAIAIGGPHYCPNFNKIQLNSEYAISHIIPEYALPLTEEMIKEAIEKTIEPIDCILLDWKGLGKSEERKWVIDLLSRLNLKYKRTNEVEK